MDVEASARGEWLKLCLSLEGKHRLYYSYDRKNAFTGGIFKKDHRI